VDALRAAIDDRTSRSRRRFRDHGVGPETGMVEICVDPFPHWYSTVDFSTIGQVPEDQRLQIIKNVRTYLLNFYYRCKFVNKEGEEVVCLDDE